jgi:nicotinate-nucleotide pyrophosphorylase (carboxylating)
MKTLAAVDTQLAIEIHRNVAAALAEDVGSGDLTAHLVAPNRAARGKVISREDAVLCGRPWFDTCFETLDASASIIWHARDGDKITAGQTLCEIHAETRALLTAERCALNFLQLLSGTATVTRHFVDAVAGTRAHIVDTRKKIGRASCRERVS